MRKNLLICSFFIILSAPLIGMLASPPSYTPSWRSFKQLEYYFFDHMGFKSSLNKAYSTILYHGLGTIPFSHVVRNEHGMLFHQANITQWCNEDLFNPFELQKISAELKYNQESLRQQNIKYLVVLAPMKEAVYQTLLPEDKRCAPALTRLQQFTDNINVPHINPLQLLRGTTAGELNYLQTDHRINGNGQVALYRAIAEALHITPAINFTKEPYKIPQGSLSTLINVTINETDNRYIPQGIKPLVKSATVVETGHFRDVTPMLTKHFTNLEVIEGKHGYELDIDAVTKQNPSVVIHQIVLESGPYTL
jgi:hypothetical protein